MYHPKPDFKLPSGFSIAYDAWLSCSCRHKGRKSVAYTYYTAVTKDGDLRTKWINHKYTFKVCKKCFEKNHEQWMVGNNLPKKYSHKELLYFRNDYDNKSNKVS